MQTHYSSLNTMIALACVVKRVSSLIIFQLNMLIYNYKTYFVETHLVFVVTVHSYSSILPVFNMTYLSSCMSLFLGDSFPDRVLLNTLCWVSSDSLIIPDSISGRRSEKLLLEAWDSNSNAPGTEEVLFKL